MLMEKQDILSKVDHTILYAYTDWEDVKRLCLEAIENKTASVCIPPCYTSRVKKAFGDQIKICVVIGFPLGYSVTSAKLEEAKAAVCDGADEVDMVINITDVKNGDYDKVTDEIKQIKKCIGDKILKVIIETCYLTEEEKIAMCKSVTEAKADYIRHQPVLVQQEPHEDIDLQQHWSDVKIKAAGGSEQFLIWNCFGKGSGWQSSAIRLFESK